MKKYVVKVTSIATDENLNFAGEIDIAYYGKDQRQLAHEGGYTEDVIEAYRLAKKQYAHAAVENDWF